MPHAGSKKTSCINIYKAKQKREKGAEIDGCPLLPEQILIRKERTAFASRIDPPYTVSARKAKNTVTVSLRCIYVCEKENCRLREETRKKK